MSTFLNSNPLWYNSK